MSHYKYLYAELDCVKWLKQNSTIFPFLTFGKKKSSKALNPGLHHCSKFRLLGKWIPETWMWKGKAIKLLFWLVIFLTLLNLYWFFFNLYYVLKSSDHEHSEPISCRMEGRAFNYEKNLRQPHAACPLATVKNSRCHW